MSSLAPLGTLVLSLLAFQACSSKIPPVLLVAGELPPPPEFKPDVSYDAIAKEYAETSPQPFTETSRAAIDEVVTRFTTTTRQAYDRFLASLTDAAPRTFDNTVGALDDFLNSFYLGLYELNYLMNVHPDNYLREVARLYLQEAEKYDIALGMNEALYRAVASLSDQRAVMAPDQRAIFDDMMLDYELSGMTKDAPTRAKIKVLLEQLADLATAFEQHLAKFQDPTVVEPSALEGMDEKFLNQLDKQEGKIVIPLYGTVVNTLLKHCANAELRRIVYTKYRNRAAEKNKPLLAEVLQKRFEVAGLLGLPSHAAVRLKPRMAKTPERVREFLRGLHTAFQQRAVQEMEELVLLKRELTKDPAAVIEPWDLHFYSTILRERRFKVEVQKFPEYFPLERVIQDGLFKVYQTLFSVTFKKVDRPVYHPDVTTYEIWDDDKLIGTFLMDLFPRPNKYTHAAQFGLRKRKILADGSIQLPEAAIVCNFAKPTPTEPSLLPPGEVETLFHEFGHLMHTLLSESRYMSHSGTAVKRDFVETPSQLLERWPMNRSIVQGFARHYKTGEAIPEEYIVYMVEQQRFLSGINTLGQVFYATYDLELHAGQPVADSTALWRELAATFPGVLYLDGTVPEASFGHLMGYDAGYYGYLWAEVLSADMFAEMQRSGLLDPKAGNRLRRIVLAPGGTVDPNDIVREFLGREVDRSAFLEEKGILVTK